jgi:hypothetical protein
VRADIASIIDTALADMRAGVSVDECLRRYPDHAAELEPILRAAAAISREAAAPLPPALEQWFASGRGEIARIARDAYARPDPLATRIRRSLTIMVAPLLRRGAPRLAVTALTTIMICMMAGLGVDAAAARSLPGESLYTWKLFSEQTRLRFASDPDTRADLTASIIEHRVREIGALVELPGARLGQYQQSIGGLHEQIPQALNELQQASPAARRLSLVRLGRLLDRAALDLRRAPDVTPGTLALAANDMLSLRDSLPADALIASAESAPTSVEAPTPAPAAQPPDPLGEPLATPSATPPSSPTATPTFPVITAPNPGDAAGAQTPPDAGATSPSTPVVELSPPTATSDLPATSTPVIPPTIALPTPTTASDLPTPLRLPNELPPSATPTAISTATATTTAADTSADTPVVVQTDAPAEVVTPTGAYTLTETPTEIYTPSATEIYTSTDTPTATPTDTPTAPPTDTPTATPTATTMPVVEVYPLLECVARINNGTSIAYFGYASEQTLPVEIPIGPQNHFSSGPNDRGQPTTFIPGRSAPYPNPAFGVVFTSDRLIWILNGRTAIASRDMQTCDPLPSAS